MKYLPNDALVRERYSQNSPVASGDANRIGEDNVLFHLAPNP